MLWPLWQCVILARCSVPIAKDFESTAIRSLARGIREEYRKQQVRKCKNLWRKRKPSSSTWEQIKSQHLSYSGFIIYRVEQIYNYLYNLSLKVFYFAKKHFPSNYLWTLHLIKILSTNFPFLKKGVNEQVTFWNASWWGNHSNMPSHMKSRKHKSAEEESETS